jgi:hypothetical protein
VPVQSEKEYPKAQQPSALRQHQTGDGGRHNSHSLPVEIAHSKHAAPL